MARVLVSFFLILMATKALAFEVNFSGYLKSYYLYQDDVEIEGIEQNIDSNYQSQNAARVMLNGFAEKHTFELHYEVLPVYYSKPQASGLVDTLGATFTVGSNIYRYKDIDDVLNDSQKHVVVWQNLDRFNYRYQGEYGDLTIGRQVVSFGSARFVNPTDIFVPFNIQTLNQEYRVGIDAIRYQAELGDFSLLDSGIIIGEDAKGKNLAAFVRAKHSVSGNDLEAMLVGLKDAWLLGGGVERALGDLGFWFEAAYMQLDNTDNYWRVSSGVDYAFSENTLGMIEYHFNGAGSNQAEDYMPQLQGEAYQRAGVYLLGEHYLIPSVSWTISPLLIMSSSAFLNLSDQSVFVNIALEQSLSDNLYSDVGLYLAEGETLQFDTAAMQLELGSEFGASANSVYASLRYYF